VPLKLHLKPEDSQGRITQSDPVFGHLPTPPKFPTIPPSGPYPMLPARLAVVAPESSPFFDELPTIGAEKRSGEQTQVDAHQPISDSGSGVLDSVPSTPWFGENLGTKAQSQSAADFVLQRLIGRGGQGEIWRAMQPSLDREVAIKVLKSGRPDRAVVDFLQEAYTSAELDHPNIVPVYELGRYRVNQRECHLLAMKLVRGQPWNEVLAADRQKPDFSLEIYLAKHLPILINVCHAVAYAHSKLIIHRDLKPRQVVMGSYGEVYLLDWGLAMCLRENVPTVTAQELPKFRTRAMATNCTGTPAYMAPEQTQGTTDDLGLWTDIYLLGAVLYELVTGRPPHLAETVTLAYTRARNNEYDPLPDFCPDELRSLITRALDSTPEKRWGSVDEFRKGIEEYLTGSGRQRESMEITQIAREWMHDMGHRAGYDVFGDIDKLLTRALHLWPNNHEAVTLKQEVLKRLAEMALAERVLPLARSLVPQIVDEHARQDLLARIEETDREIKRAAAARKRLVWMGRSLITALIMMSMTAIWLYSLHKSNEALAETRQSFADRQTRLAEMFRSVNILRSEENRLAERFRSVLPLPDRIISESELPTMKEKALNLELVEALLNGRNSLRTERDRLSKENIVRDALESEPAQLTIGDATYALYQAEDYEGFLLSYGMYQRAHARHPFLAEPLTGMGIAAARAGEMTSATLAFEEASRLILNTKGATHPDYAAALAFEGEAHQKLGKESEFYMDFYRRSLDILLPQWNELSIDLADRWIQMGEWENAMLVTSPTLTIQQKLVPGDSEDTSNYQDFIGSILIYQGHHADAEAYLRTSLETRRRLHKNQDHPMVAVSLNNLAVCLRHLGRLKESELLQRESYEMRVRLYGERHLDTATAAMNLGYLIGQLGRSVEAESYIRAGLETRVALLGDRHPETASAYTSLGSNLDAQGRYKEAEPYRRLAIEIRERAFGRNHPATAAGMNNLAWNLNNQGRLDEAEQLYRDALAINIASQGDTHHSTLSSYNNLASCLVNQGKLIEAEPILKRVVALRRETLGSDHPDLATALNNLATLLVRQGKHAEAEPVHREAWELSRRIYGDLHPFVATTAFNLANALFTLDRLAEADPLLANAIVVRTQLLGPDNASTLAAIEAHASLLATMGETTRALELAEKALAGRRKIVGEDSPDLIQGLTVQAGIQSKLGNLQRAEEILREAAAIASGESGERRDRAFKPLIDLAECLKRQGRLTEAIEAAREAARRRMPQGAMHPDLGQALSSLSSIMVQAKRLDQAHRLAMLAIGNLGRARSLGHEFTQDAMDTFAGILDDEIRLEQAAQSEETFDLARDLNSWLLQRHAMIAKPRVSRLREDALHAIRRLITWSKYDPRAPQAAMPWLDAIGQSIGAAVEQGPDPAATNPIPSDVLEQWSVLIKVPAPTDESLLARFPAPTIEQIQAALDDVKVELPDSPVTTP